MQADALRDVEAEAIAEALKDDPRRTLRRLVRNGRFSLDRRVVARLRARRYINRAIDELHQLGLVLIVDTRQVKPSPLGSRVHAVLAKGVCHA